jgi:hypothetical protein
LLTIFCFLLVKINFAQHSMSGKIYKTQSKSIELPLRLGFGSHRNVYSEIGYQYLISDGKKHGCIYNFSPSSKCSTLEWTVKSQNFKDVFAIKVGYEKMLNFLLSYAIEVKYQTNMDYKDVVIFPKIGLCATLIYSLNYGYNISTSKYPFGNVSRPQFSIVFNLNRIYKI